MDARVLSPRSYRLIITIILRGHPAVAPRGGTLENILGVEPREGAVTRATHLGGSPHLPSDKEIYVPAAGLPSHICTITFD